MLNEREKTSTKLNTFKRIRFIHVLVQKEFQKHMSQKFIEMIFNCEF